MMRSNVIPAEAGTQRHRLIPKGLRLWIPAFAGMTMMLAGCQQEPAPQEPANGVIAGGPPPIPPYQMREELAGGNRLSGGDGKDLFSNRCGACHLAGGMGSNLLTKQRMMMGETPDKGLLANRTDMTPDYVKSVVRNGKMAMPRLTRVDVTDAELNAIADYLGKVKS